MEEEKDFEEVYDDDSREDLVDNDEISAEEEGFMSGYEERKEKVKEEFEGDEAYENAFDKTDKTTKKGKK
jgi:hypothetical protein